MSKIKTGNKAHDDACDVAESTRQSAITATTTQANARTAEITYYRALKASAIANNCSPAQFTTALMELGTGGV